MIKNFGSWFSLIFFGMLTALAIFAVTMRDANLSRLLPMLGLGEPAEAAADAPAGEASPATPAPTAASPPPLPIPSPPAAAVATLLPPSKRPCPHGPKQQAAEGGRAGVAAHDKAQESGCNAGLYLHVAVMIQAVSRVFNGGQVVGRKSGGFKLHTMCQPGTRGGSRWFKEQAAAW